MFRFLLVAAVAAAGADAAAQPGATAGQPIQYRSAFDGYRPWSAQPPRNWREVNDEVGRLGGHAGHLRSSPAAPEQEKPAAKAPAPMHHDHGQQGRTVPEVRR